MPTYYVPDDYPTIQQAINAAINGDMILVRPGTYTEPQTTTPMITINKELIVQSTDGPEVTILDGNSATERYYMVSIQADNVVFDGFTVTNPSYTGTADASGILTSLDGGGYTNLTISNNIVHDIGSLTRPVASFGTFGINVGPVDTLEIANNEVYNIGNNDASDPNNNGWAIGVFVYGNDSLNTANNVNIHDNTVYNIVSPVAVNDGINCGGDSENITVANNNIHASSLKRGIVTSSGMVGPVTITGNTVTGATLYGILLRSPYAQVVTNNTITQNEIGIQINATVTTTPVIHDNNIYNNVEYGLLNLAPVTVDAQNNWWEVQKGRILLELIAFLVYPLQNIRRICKPLLQLQEHLLLLCDCYRVEDLQDLPMYQTSVVMMRLQVRLEPAVQRHLPQLLRTCTIIGQELLLTRIRPSLMD